MPLIAIDWGTTNRRAYRLADDGAVEETVRDDRGVLAMAGGDWAAEVATIRTRLGDLPVLIAGMAGSNRGWREVPYVPCPARLEAVAAGILWIEPGRTGIVPGLSLVEDGRADVMRGEEVQLFGALAAGLAPPDALLCQPGTHCKWAQAAGGAITRFTTAMTGELFALLRGHGILAAQLGGVVAAGNAVLEGVEEAKRGDLAASLFGIRAGGVLGLRADADAASFASGLLIGSDVHVRLRDRPGETVYLLADPVLAGLYDAAVAANGGRAVTIDSHDAFVAGIVRIWSLAR